MEDDLLCYRIFISAINMTNIQSVILIHIIILLFVRGRKNINLISFSTHNQNYILCGQADCKVISFSW